MIGRVDDTGGSLAPLLVPSVRMKKSRAGFFSFTFFTYVRD